ncbi:uncharacterized protein N7518_004684 [Penicillium psychrosexuale]|uniref:uncharacterized protein n=1 Tax=Penicillium psychrosexuale TaxID=1002107 RepID=UPI002545119A|nr:uncharacterized protein N7518_004684 [Penicillium psychrosexuale]KAJ5796144.1 hypothetical protein N7518_004684 [Penicillium psychrosexuale]
MTLPNPAPYATQTSLRYLYLPQSEMQRFMALRYLPRCSKAGALYVPETCPQEGPEIPQTCSLQRIPKPVLASVIRLYQQYSYSVWPVVNAEALWEE